MNRRLILIVCLLLVSSIIVHAQSEDSITFAKGRIITSLYGTISNQQVTIASGGNVNTTSYTLGTKSGIFLKNNWVMGVNISLSKSELSYEYADMSTENFLIGPWTRLYFAQKGSVSLYAELSPFFTSIYRLNTIYDSGNILSKQEVKGYGFGVTPGIGFTYIISKNVGFGMAVSNPLGKVDAKTKDLILDTIVMNTYSFRELQFSFSFQIYLDQFFF